MRTSSGFLLTGWSGNTRIHTRPPRLMKCVSARRAASIWREVRRPRVTAFRPYSPKLTLLPRRAKPRLRPFICLRFFVRFGCNIFKPYQVFILLPLSLRERARGEGDIKHPSSPSFPAGVREHPAHPFGGVDVHWTSTITLPHLPQGEKGVSRCALRAHFVH